MTLTDIVLVANSPGELSALVKPVAEEFSHDQAKRLVLVLTPCQYTSGRENEFTKTLKGIDELITSTEYKRWIFLNQKPRINFSRQGVVLFLGGDLAHAMLIARKLKYPAYAYIDERIAWKKFYRKFFVPDQSTYDKFERQTPAGKLEIVGDLMVDSVAGLKKWAPENKVVTFMPGSRQWEIDYMTPLYKEIMALVKKEIPEVKFQLVSSPFVPARPIEGTKMIPFEELANSEVIVTIPGTNTAKLAARGIPMVVVFPLNHPEVIPMEGIADLIGKIPVAGKQFKKWVAETVNNRTKFFALPNQKGGREIAPEIRGIIDPLGVAMKVVELLKHPEIRETMSRDLAAAMGEPGAAKKIVEEINAGLS
jgi:lipid-A-disaccharide synthase